MVYLLLLVLQLHFQSPPPGDHFLCFDSCLIDLVNLCEDLLLLNVALQHGRLHTAHLLNHGEILFFLLFVGARWWCFGLRVVPARSQTLPLSLNIALFSFHLTDQLLCILVICFLLRCLFQWLSLEHLQLFLLSPIQPLQIIVLKGKLLQLLHGRLLLIFKLILKQIQLILELSGLLCYVFIFSLPVLEFLLTYIHLIDQFIVALLLLPITHLRMLILLIDLMYFLLQLANLNLNLLIVLHLLIIFCLISLHLLGEFILLYFLQLDLLH